MVCSIFNSFCGPVKLTIHNVLDVSEIKFKLFSLRAASRNGQSCNGFYDKIDLFSKQGGQIRFEEYVNLYRWEAHRLPHEHANAVTVPGVHNASNDGIADINVFHALHAHSNEALLREMAKTLDITLTGEPKLCYGYSVGRGSTAADPVVNSFPCCRQPRKNLY